MISARSLLLAASALSMSATSACGKRPVTNDDAGSLSSSSSLSSASSSSSASSPSGSPSGSPSALLADPTPSPAPPRSPTGCTPSSPCARRVPCDAAPCPRDPAWKIEELALGGSFACARYKNGRVWCTSPSPVVELAITDVSRVVAGSGGHACVLASGSVECWGVGKSGQLGNGELTMSPTPERVKGITNPVAIAAGASHTCAIEKAGTVMCWGENSEGQLGDGTTENRATPVAVKRVTSAKAITLGLHHGCAVEKDGHVVCWGRKRGGPRGEAVAIPKLANVDQLAGMRTDTCARSGRVVSCWGALFGPEPTPRTELAGAEHLTADGYDACIIHANGSVHCVNPSTQKESYDLPRSASGASARVLAGGTCVVRSDDTVACTELSGMAPKLEQL